MPGGLTCCPQCFGDHGLEKIISGMTEVRGTCPVCGTDGVILVEAIRLREVFGPLINIYEPNDGGRLLVDFLREDWDLFHHPRLDNARAKELLAEVLNDGEIVRKTLSPSAKYQSDRLIVWETLRTELMHENRYFPATPLDLDRLEELLELLRAAQVTRTWYRARLQTSDAPFPLAEMSAPPPRLASHGRANPAGIPYLYLASDPKTSIAELRPHTGERACVAEFLLPEGLNLVDLRNPRRAVSPFAFADEDAIGRLRGDVAFLARLGEELTRPVVPQGAPFDYVPSQYLCEFIKNCGYEGVLYRSSVGDGINLAFFKPSAAQAQSVAQYDIIRVDAEIRAAEA